MEEATRTDLHCCSRQASDSSLVSDWRKLSDQPPVPINSRDATRHNPTRWKLDRLEYCSSESLMLQPHAMAQDKRPLSFRLITAETQEAVYREALDYYQAHSPCEARDRNHALAYYNDSPAGVGGGGRAVEWFESEEELLQAIPGYLLVMNSGPRLCDELSKNLAVVVSAYWDGEITRDRAMHLINDGTTDFFQVEWWGTKEELLIGGDAFPLWLRSAWRGSTDSSPLSEDEVEPFLEYLSCDYMC